MCIPISAEVRGVCVCGGGAGWEGGTGWGHRVSYQILKNGKLDRISIFRGGGRGLLVKSTVTFFMEV